MLERIKATHWVILWARDQQNYRALKGRHALDPSGIRHSITYRIVTWLFWRTRSLLARCGILWPAIRARPPPSLVGAGDIPIRASAARPERDLLIGDPLTATTDTPVSGGHTDPLILRTSRPAKSNPSTIKGKPGQRFRRPFAKRGVPVGRVITSRYEPRLEPLQRGSQDSRNAIVQSGRVVSPTRHPAHDAFTN